MKQKKCKNKEYKKMFKTSKNKKNLKIYNLSKITNKWIKIIINKIKIIKIPKNSQKYNKE